MKIYGITYDDFYIQVFRYFLENIKNIDIKKIIIGHEHGAVKKKCHLQIVVL